MKSLIKSTYILILITAIFSIHANAQKVDNLHVDVTGDLARINYDLLDLMENQEVEVRVYATIKGFQMRLYRATGDVGKGITGGVGKSIAWNNDEELTRYNKKDITFKIDVISKLQPQKQEKAKNKGIFAGITGLFEKD
ncbi:MAG: hypothetical protein M3421_04465 [Bacteroidota bacterium]|jgi:hypothetical protein|nr:hypothetical protein [Bacteroidota bacterium]